MLSSDFGTKRETSRSSRSLKKTPFATVISRHAHHRNEYVGDSNTKEHSVDGKESPTLSTMSTSSLSSHPVEQTIMCTSEKYCTSPSKREKDTLNDDNEIVRMNVMSIDKTPDRSPPDTGAMIEVSKITALVEEELHSQRLKHKDQLNRTVTKYKGRIESFQIEIDRLRGERDEVWRELESCKRSLTSQRFAAERNDRFQSQQKEEIQMLEERREMFEELEIERDALLEEVTKNQERQQKTKAELSALKVRVREDSQKRLSVMECLSASWDAEKKEAKLKENLLNSELEIMSKTLKAEQEYLKHKNKEFSKLEAQYRSTKADLYSMKKTMGAKKEEIEEDLRRERESRKRATEEHTKVLKLKNDEIYMAETTILSMKAELKSARENFTLKEESMARSIEGMKEYNENSFLEQHEGQNPEVKMLCEENSRLDGEVKELQRQVESYLANMALQQEFCDSLKSRIYKEQESEHEQIEEMHRLRKQLKKQQKQSAEKDRHIDELKQLLKDSTIRSVKVKPKQSSSRNVTGEKKSRTRKTKSSHSRRSGYGTS